MGVEVLTYTDPSCGHCRQLKQYLSRHGVPYRDRDVTADPDAAADLERMDAPGVPVTFIGPDVIYGFDQEKLEAAFEANGVVVHQAG
jgi:glutaredoxin